MDSTGHCYSPDCGLLEHESVVDLYFCEYLLACIDFVGLAEFGFLLRLTTEVCGHGYHQQTDELGPFGVRKVEVFYFESKPICKAFREKKTQNLSYSL